MTFVNKPQSLANRKSKTNIRRRRQIFGAQKHCIDLLNGFDQTVWLTVNQKICFFSPKFGCFASFLCRGNGCQRNVLECINHWFLLLWSDTFLLHIKMDHSIWIFLQPSVLQPPLIDLIWFKSTITAQNCVVTMSQLHWNVTQLQPKCGKNQWENAKKFERNFHGPQKTKPWYVTTTRQYSRLWSWYIPRGILCAIASKQKNWLNHRYYLFRRQFCQLAATMCHRVIKFVWIIIRRRINKNFRDFFFVAAAALKSRQNACNYKSLCVAAVQLNTFHNIRRRHNTAFSNVAYCSLLNANENELWHEERLIGSNSNNNGKSALSRDEVIYSLNV